MMEQINGECRYYCHLTYQKWVEEELSLDDYKAMLNFELSSDELNYIPVYSIRTSEIRPDSKKKMNFMNGEICLN